MSKTLLFFMSNECRRCKKCKKELSNMDISENIEVKEVDAFADETQDFCDLYDVDALPHLELIEDDSTIWKGVGKNIDMKSLKRELKG